MLVCGRRAASCRLASLAPGITIQQGVCKRSFAKVATVRQRLLIWLLDRFWHLIWATEDFTAPYYGAPQFPETGQLGWVSTTVPSNACHMAVRLRAVRSDAGASRNTETGLLRMGMTAVCRGRA